MSGSTAEEIPNSNPARAIKVRDFPGQIVLVSRISSAMVVSAYLALIDWSNPPLVKRLSWVLVLGAIVSFSEPPGSSVTGNAR